MIHCDLSPISLTVVLKIEVITVDKERVHMDPYLLSLFLSVLLIFLDTIFLLLINQNRHKNRQINCLVRDLYMLNVLEI